MVWVVISYRGGKGRIRLLDRGVGTRTGGGEKRGRGAGRTSQNRRENRGKDWLTPQKKWEK
jgi:hypothetical protein